MKILQNPVAMVSMQVLGGPLGASVANALSAFQALGQLQGAMQMLQKVLGQIQPKAGQSPAAQPQPFSGAQFGGGNPLNALQSGAQQLQHFGRPPIVGNDSQWPAFANSINQRITGTAANTSKLFDGSNPWSKQDGMTEERAAVGWAMQQNDTLRYDADRKMFYTTNQDGSATDAMSLNDAVNTIRANGGANPGNGAAYQAVGQLANASSQAADLQDVIKSLQKLLETLQRGGVQGSNGAATGGVSGGGGSVSSPFSGGGGTGSTSGAGGSSPSGGGESLENTVSSAGSKIDDMFAQAEKLMQSDKPSDQLKAQMMMQKAQRMFEAISKLLEQKSKAQSTAIQNIK